MIELYLNGVKCPVRTGQEVAGSYQISAFADISTSSGNRSTRFDISATTEVLTALGNPHILVNASTIPKSKIEARLYVDGLDMKIEYAKILRATDERVEVYLFGGSSDFFSLLKGQNLNDLDLSDLDHTFDDTTIQAALQATSGYIYPIIDYGNMTSASNRIRLDQGQIFPAVFCSTILDEIVTQFGYTLSGDLHEDADFLTLILPFIYEKPQLPPSYFNGSGFLATNITDQAIGAGVTDYVDLPLEISDPSSVYTNDGVKYCFIAPADGYYRFRLKVVTGYSLYWNEQLLRVRLDPVSGGADSTLREYGAADIEGSGITGEYGFFQTDTDFFNLTAGDKVYLEWENPTAASVSILSGYDASGNPRSYFQLLAAEEIELGYGDKWFVAANLPRIACTDFIRFLAYEFACLITADGTSKTLSFTAFSTILDRVDEGTYKDWSEKLDLSDPPEVGYDLKGFAQRNLLRWSKDDTVGDIRGADYDFIIEDESLDGEKTLYTAPFAASGRQVRLSQAISVTEIRVYEEDLSDSEDAEGTR